MTIFLSDRKNENFERKNRKVSEKITINFRTRIIMSTIRIMKINRQNGKRNQKRERQLVAAANSVASIRLNEFVSIAFGVRMPT